MRFNDDLTQRASVLADAPFVPSPTQGVERRMLDRIGDEVARATSLVRFAPASRFPAHRHGGGEEFYVVEGVFEDESGAWPAGAYVRNPPGASHAPGSGPGCLLFVKLWQFAPDDQTPVALTPEAATGALFDDGAESVRLERWAAGEAVSRALPGGGEFLCLAGGFAEGGADFAPTAWLRLPAGARLRATAGPQGATVWMKTGHLADPSRESWARRSSK